MYNSHPSSPSLPSLPSLPPSLPPSPPLPTIPSPPLPSPPLPSPPSLPPFPLPLVTQQIHCPFLPKQSPSIVQYPVRWIVDSTLHIAHLADVFIPTSIPLRWEEFSNATIIARKLFTQIPTAVYSQVLVLIYISMSEQVNLGKVRTCPSFETEAKWIRNRCHGLSLFTN